MEVLDNVWQSGVPGFWGVRKRGFIDLNEKVCSFTHMLSTVSGSE